MDDSAVDAEIFELFAQSSMDGPWMLDEAGANHNVEIKPEALEVQDLSSFFFPISGSGGGMDAVDIDMKQELIPSPSLAMLASGGCFFAADAAGTSSTSSSDSSSSASASTSSVNKEQADDDTWTAGQRLCLRGLTPFTQWVDVGSDDEGDDDDDDPQNHTKKRRRTRQKPPNPDADLIAQATEENFRSLGLDPESKEGKAQRRRIRNRLSAQFHRERKRTYIAHLEGLVKQRDVKLQEAAAALDRLTAENALLQAKVGDATHGVPPRQPQGGMKKSDSMANYSSAGSTTSASLSDDAADDVSTAFPSPPPTPPLAATSELLTSPTNGGRRFRGASIARSGAPLLSVLFMLGITMFSPQQQRQQQPQAQQQQQRTHMTPSDAGTGSIFTAPLQLLQLPKPQGGEAAPTLAHGHGRVVLSSGQDAKPKLFVSSAASSSSSAAPAAAQQPPVIMHPQLFASAGRLGLSQPLWKYDAHVCNLYPPVARFQSPFYDTDGVPYEAAVGGNATAAGAQRRTRRYLRTRSVNTTAAAPARTVAAAAVVPDAAQGSDTENSLSLVPAHRLPALPGAAAAAASTGFASPPLSEPVSPTAALSMSRVLLTTGRALLDPSIVVGAARPVPPPGTVHVQPQPAAAGEAGADGLAAATALSTLSRWVTTAGAGSVAGTAAEVPVPAAAPPVVSVGLGSIGASIGVTAAAGGVPGAPAGSSNMLVMLLPASAVRWGKVWSESSEGTMEAMLNGMNSNKTAGWANAMGGSSNNTANAEGMWVEIGCSIFSSADNRRRIYHYGWLGNK